MLDKKIQQFNRIKFTADVAGWLSEGAVGQARIHVPAATKPLPHRWSQALAKVSRTTYQLQQHDEMVSAKTHRRRHIRAGDYACRCCCQPRDKIALIINKKIIQHIIKNPNSEPPS